MLRRAVALLALAALCLSGCSSDEDDKTPDKGTDPPASAFGSGACSALAPAVLQAGTRIRQLGEAAPEPELLQQLADSQAALQALPAAQELIAGMGFVRLRVASGTYTSDLSATVLTSYQQLVATCTGLPGPVVSPTDVLPSIVDPGAPTAPTASTAPTAPTVTPGPS